jgi:hypothetical protein
MESVSVRLLVARGRDESIIETSLTSNESLDELNARIFPDSMKDSQIKWIYHGRTLTGTTPSAISAGSVFHVYAYLP